MGCAALLAGSGAAPARAAAAGSCPDPQYVLQAYNASHAWNRANTGAGQTIGVIGAPDRVAEAVCAAKALAPEADVVAGSARGPIVVVADNSVAPPSSGAGTLVIAAAGDTSGPMPERPPGVVNVAAADISSNLAQATSSYGPQVLLAAYGNDTSTAAGYVGALAAILHGQNPKWTARQVAAQMAGSIGYLSGSNADDHLGFGIISPDQAVSVDPIDPSSLPTRFATVFPANLPPGNTAPSTRPASPTAPASSASSGPSSAATETASAFPSPSASPTDIGSANLFPTNQAFSPSPSNGSRAAAGGSGGAGGFSPVLLIGFIVIIAGGGYLLWQRRRQPAPADVKPESEWEAPSGPRHSGYSPPEE